MIDEISLTKGHIMKRRSFFAGAAALGSIPLMTPKAEAQVRDAGLKITGFELWQYTGDAKRYNDYLAEGYPEGGWPVPETILRPTQASSRVLPAAAEQQSAGQQSRDVAHEQSKIVTDAGTDRVDRLGRVEFIFADLGTAEHLGFADQARL